MYITRTFITENIKGKLACCNFCVVVISAARSSRDITKVTPQSTYNRGSRSLLAAIVDASSGVHVWFVFVLYAFHL